MLDFIREILASEKILISGCINLRQCRIVKPYLLERVGISEGSAVIFAIPYLTPEAVDASRNISSYAVPNDYHIYIKELTDRIIPKLTEKYPGNRFALFADHSPIDERDAAVKAGIGVIGLNRMIITEIYSSYVFLAEIITDAHLDNTAVFNGKCEECGKCIQACPGCLSGKGSCLSELTQKKGELTYQEKCILSSHPLIWGCDTCQESCPHTIRALNDGSIFTPIEFFRKNLTPVIDKSALENMTDEEFSRHAYSWRGRQTILRNIEIKNDIKNESENFKC